MNKKVFTTAIAFLGLCTTVFADVAINSTNFPDAIFRNYVLLNYGSPGTTTISDATIANAKKINVSLKSITNLKGIEYFTALTDLDCSNNQLTSLDVSKLTNLTNLICFNNQLTSLDVSKLINLKELNCFKNQLSALDLSGLAELTRLNCNTNKIENLNVSGCTKFFDLACNYNQITALDLSVLTNLANLYCSDNLLTALNLSNLTNLHLLHCHNNQLSNLEVSNLTKLQELDCSNTNLSTLDVSQNTQLLWLNCSNNKLSTLDLSELDLLPSYSFYGSGQSISAILKGSNNNYSVDFPLNNPSGFVEGISYTNDVLYSTSNTITESPFNVQTGRTIWYNLSGTITFDYQNIASTNDIKMSESIPVAYYSITGIRLSQEPKSGFYIVVYNNGTAEKVIKNKQQK